MFETGKIDTYSQHRNNKRALYKKKMRLDALSWVFQSKKEDLTWDTFQSTLELPNQAYLGIVCALHHKNKQTVFDLLFEWKVYFDFIFHESLPSSLLSQVIIGDEVFFEIKNGKNLIYKRKERKNLLKRYKWDSNKFWLWSKVEQYIASNIDYWIIVASAKNPDFHSDFIDRYLVLFQYGNIQPIICITKSDIEKLESPILDWYQKQWIKVFFLSVYTWMWCEAFMQEILSKRVVFVWNSGVWKTSLTNWFLQKEVSQTNSVSNKTHQGRHTTTGSSLYEWAKDSYVIDTPWIRSLDLFEIPQNDLKKYFTDFEEFATWCKFRDCSHIHEPACWVKQAYQEGTLSKERYESFVRLYHKLV